MGHFDASEIVEAHRVDFGAAHCRIALPGDLCVQIELNTGRREMGCA